MDEVHCDPDVKDSIGWTPLQLACRWVYMYIVALHHYVVHVHEFVVFSGNALLDLI